MEPTDNQPKKAYCLNFSTYPPTPNHNPFIDEEQDNTHYSVQCGLEFLHKFLLLAETNQPEGLNLTSRENMGFQRHVECLVEALNYENNHRPLDDDPPKEKAKQKPAHIQKLSLDKGDV